jgi:hypothetical protein
MNTLGKMFNKWKVERRFDKGFYPRIGEDLKNKLKLRFIDYRYGIITLGELFEIAKQLGFDVDYFFPFFIELIRVDDIKQYRLRIKGE